MRTKTLLLTAALGAAGVATSMAQSPVYSVNAVGYVNTTLVPGFNLISNPLNNTAANGNTISSLFSTLPFGTQVYKFVDGSFQTATYDDIEEAYVPAAAGALTVTPGEGVFVKIPGSANQTVTFVGEVPQGDLHTPLVQGLQIVSSQVPQAGTAAALGLAGAPGDQLYQFDESKQAYDTFTFDDIENKWIPDLKSLDVGEAFFLKKVAAGTWDRSFSVNQ